MSTKKSAKEVLKSMGIPEPTFASLIKTHRQCEELTQAQLAKRLGISVSHLSDLENERKFVSIERAKYFARKLQEDERYYVFVVLRDLLRKADCDYEIELKLRKVS